MEKNCPICNNPLMPVNYGITEWSDGNDATLDCMACNGLLVIKDGALLDFHRYINSKDKDWPINGKDTAFIE